MESMEEKTAKKNNLVLLFLTLLILVLGVAFIFSGFNLIQNNEIAQNNQPTGAVLPGKTENQASQFAQVVRVVDGDTIEVSIQGERYKVRYIGVDTPETVDPRRVVGCFGKEASAKNKRLVEGKEVNIVRDVSETDKFGRLLRYVYVKGEVGEEIFVNDYLVREGYAKATTYPPDVKFTDQFKEAEREARASDKGLWGRCQGV